MTKLSTILKDHAETVRLATPEAVAIEHLKQAGFSDADARYQVAQHIMEKEATSALAMKGVDHEEAVKLVKAANINVAELSNFVLEIDEDPTVELLNKTAEYIDALEAQIEGLKAEIEKQASEHQAELIEATKQPIEIPEQLSKLASAAQFTQEDLEQLQKVSPAVLQKVASAMDEPWGMGNGVGMARPKTDPLLEFMLS
jgi:transcriptional regulator with XRE-family HTH domain